MNSITGARVLYTFHQGRERYTEQHSLISHYTRDDVRTMIGNTFSGVTRGEYFESGVEEFWNTGRTELGWETWEIVK